jgi:predicted S18 family serine protease
MRSLLLVILLLSASFACDGTVSQYVPAVLGQGGGLINVTATLVPGEGDAYVTVYPLIGLSTQHSIDQAVLYAHAMSGDSRDCDVLFKFGDEYAANYIEGPSAGSALTVMTYALLENRSIRDDTIITGSVNRFGKVGPVGGTYEKAKGAAAMGADYFITPMGGFYEVLLLKNIEEEEGITILEAERVEDIIAFMTDNESIEQKPLDAREREIPELSPYNGTSLASFEAVGTRMIELERDALQGFKTNDNETETIRDFFRNELERQGSLLEQGYVFSAANEAFLNYIDVSTIAVIQKGRVDLPRKKGELGICLTGIYRPRLTDSNFEWIVGSDLRGAWAYDQYETTDTDDDLLADEKFISYHDLMYGDAWCNVAKSLVASAPSGGKPLNESDWKGLAEKRLDEARELGTTASDTQKKLKIAEQSFSDGNYGAAIFDAVFVIEMEQASDHILAGDVTDADVDALLSERRNTLWGNVYQSHAAYLDGLNESDGAYKTAKFAKGLERAAYEMEALAQPMDDGSAVDVEEIENVLLVALIVSLFLFIIVLILIRRAYGIQRKGYGKAYRAKQEKGRA